MWGDLVKEAEEEGRLGNQEGFRVNYEDIFNSPWCCDSSHEERYEVLMQEMHSLELDRTVVVLLSVMALFDSHQVESLTARDTILSHSRKFSLLLQRYLVESKPQTGATALQSKYQDALKTIREMAEILINKRLIC